MRNSWSWLRNVFLLKVKTHNPQKQLNRDHKDAALLQNPGSVPIKISTEELPQFIEPSSHLPRLNMQFLSTAWKEKWIKAWHRKLLSITAVLSSHTAITYATWQWLQHKPDGRTTPQLIKTASKTPCPNLCFLSFMETSTSCDLLNLLSSVFISNTISQKIHSLNIHKW